MMLKKISTFRYSQGTGEVWLDNLQCTSSDVILAACTHRGFGVEDCSHSEDVALSCSTSTSTGMSVL